MRRVGESVPHTSAISSVTGRILFWKSSWDPLKPALKFRGERRIRWPFQFDFTANFAYHQNAGEEIRIVDCSVPCLDVCVGQPTLAQFGQYVVGETRFFENRLSCGGNPLIPLVTFCSKFPPLPFVPLPIPLLGRSTPSTGLRPGRPSRDRREAPRAPHRWDRITPPWEFRPPRQGV
jgi:hypothetical protein